MKMNVQCNFFFLLISHIYIYIYIYVCVCVCILINPVRWHKLLGSGSTALSYQNCVITPGWRLMRAGYRTCFHTLYNETIFIHTCIYEQIYIHIFILTHAHIYLYIHNCFLDVVDRFLWKSFWFHYPSNLEGVRAKTLRQQYYLSTTPRPLTP